MSTLPAGAADRYEPPAVDLLPALFEAWGLVAVQVESGVIQAYLKVGSTRSWARRVARYLADGAGCTVQVRGMHGHLRADPGEQMEGCELATSAPPPRRPFVPLHKHAYTLRPWIIESDQQARRWITKDLPS